MFLRIIKIEWILIEIIISYILALILIIERIFIIWDIIYFLIIKRLSTIFTGSI